MWCCCDDLQNLLGLTLAGQQCGETLKDYHRCLNAKNVEFHPRTLLYLSPPRLRVCFVNKINIKECQWKEKSEIKFNFVSLFMNAICVFDHLFQSQQESRLIPGRLVQVIYEFRTLKNIALMIFLEKCFEQWRITLSSWISTVTDICDKKWRQIESFFIYLHNDRQQTASCYISFQLS